MPWPKKRGVKAAGPEEARSVWKSWNCLVYIPVPDLTPKGTPRCVLPASLCTAKLTSRVVRSRVGLD